MSNRFPPFILVMPPVLNSSGEWVGEFKYKAVCGEGECKFKGESRMTIQAADQDMKLHLHREHKVSLNSQAFRSRA